MVSPEHFPDESFNVDGRGDVQAGEEQLGVAQVRNARPGSAAGNHLAVRNMKLKSDLSVVSRFPNC